MTRSNPALSTRTHSTQPSPPDPTQTLPPGGGGVAQQHRHRSAHRRRPGGAHPARDALGQRQRHRRPPHRHRRARRRRRPRRPRGRGGRGQHRHRHRPGPGAFVGGAGRLGFCAVASRGQGLWGLDALFAGRGRGGEGLRGSRTCAAHPHRIADGRGKCRGGAGAGPHLRGRWGRYGRRRGAWTPGWREAAAEISEIPPPPRGPGLAVGGLRLRTGGCSGSQKWPQTP
jgi:hypothetical protein